MKPIETLQDLEAVLREEKDPYGLLVYEEPIHTVHLHYQSNNDSHPWYVTLDQRESASVPKVRVRGKTLGEALTRAFEAHQAARTVIEKA